MATKHQSLYLANLIFKNQEDDNTLITICNSIPKNNEKYPVGDYRQILLAEKLEELNNNEVSDIIEYFTKNLNRFGKKPRVMQMHIPLNRIFKYLIK